MSTNFHAGCAGENPDSGNGETGMRIKIARKSRGILSMNEMASRGMRVQLRQAARMIGGALSRDDERKRYP
ncbi:hypothetical protein [Burkholderia arboris]|uniref:hypothetical protein n=1 Tax=Burkholderia arboris TaxID=488730 RepID=UPI0012D8B0C3|nr:hypothetical protein [Burkholderia arboris]MCA8491730.1 hypothetical protein [Burkholderia arboris]